MYIYFLVLVTCLLLVSMFSSFFPTCFSHQQSFIFKNFSLPRSASSRIYLATVQLGHLSLGLVWLGGWRLLEEWENLRCDLQPVCLAGASDEFCEDSCAEWSLSAGNRPQDFWCHRSVVETDPLALSPFLGRSTDCNRETGLMKVILYF